MIIVVVGPTGVGKTKMSVKLAKKFNGIVVNADSMQFYKGLNIGTAKVREEEKEGIPHYLFDIVSVEEMYTIYDYQRDLRNFISEHQDENIILVGGSGLYIKAGLYDYEFLPEKDNNQYEDKTNEELYELVCKIDPNTEIHPHNRPRLIRRLNKNSVSLNKDKLLYDACFIGLTTSREELYNRIDKRALEMIDAGLIEEVKSFYEQNIRSKAIMTGIGYKELYDYFDGNITKEEAISLIQKRSRKYAKRQYTWFKNQMDIAWFDVDFLNFEHTISEVVNYIEANNK